MLRVHSGRSSRATSSTVFSLDVWSKVCTGMVVCTTPKARPSGEGTGWGGFSQVDLSTDPGGFERRVHVALAIGRVGVAHVAARKP